MIRFVNKGCLKECKPYKQTLAFGSNNITLELNTKCCNDALNCNNNRLQITGTEQITQGLTKIKTGLIITTASPAQKLPKFLNEAKLLQDRSVETWKEILGYEFVDDDNILFTLTCTDDLCVVMFFKSNNINELLAFQKV